MFACTVIPSQFEISYECGRPVLVSVVTELVGKDKYLLRYVNTAAIMLGRKKYLLFYKYRLIHPYHSKFKLFSFLL